MPLIVKRFRNARYKLLYYCFYIGFVYSYCVFCWTVGVQNSCDSHVKVCFCSIPERELSQCIWVLFCKKKFSRRSMVNQRTTKPYQSYVCSSSNLLLHVCSSLSFIVTIVSSIKKESNPAVSNKRYQPTISQSILFGPSNRINPPVTSI